MKNPYRLLSAAALGLSGLTPVQAVVVNSAFGAVNSEALASPFSNVVRLSVGGGVCTGALISATTILTAKHCTSGVAVGNMTVTFDQNGDGNVNGLDQVTGVLSKFEAPNAPSNPNLIDGTDLAMLTLSGLLPIWATSFQQLWDGSVLGSLATMVGYGGQGLDSLTPGTAGGTRRAAENIVDKVGAGGFAQLNSANIISTDFDDVSGLGNTLGGAPVNSAATPLLREGTTAGGDSGGPLLVNFGGNWLIAGVLSGGSDGTSSFGDISWWTGVGNYRTQIEAAGGVFFRNITDNTVPEPGSFALAALALFTAGALGKRRQSH